MASFNKDKLVLLSQGIGGSSKTWAYTDTGLLIADVNEVAGFFTTGYDCGMRHGDLVLVTEGDTGTVDTSGRQTGGRRQYTGTVLAAVDTGATQITLGLTTLTGDTS
jgi:hypothetical protein